MSDNGIVGCIIFGVLLVLAGLWSLAGWEMAAITAGIGFVAVAVFHAVERI